MEYLNKYYNYFLQQVEKTGIKLKTLDDYQEIYDNFITIVFNLNFTNPLIEVLTKYKNQVKIVDDYYGYTDWKNIYISKEIIDLIFNKEIYLDIAKEIYNMEFWDRKEKPRNKNFAEQFNIQYDFEEKVAKSALAVLFLNVYILLLHELNHNLSGHFYMYNSYLSNNPKLKQLVDQDPIFRNIVFSLFNIVEDSFINDRIIYWFLNINYNITDHNTLLQALKSNLKYSKNFSFNLTLENKNKLENLMFIYSVFSYLKSNNKNLFKVITKDQKNNKITFLVGVSELGNKNLSKAIFELLWFIKNFFNIEKENEYKILLQNLKNYNIQKTTEDDILKPTLKLLIKWYDKFKEKLEQLKKMLNNYNTIDDHNKTNNNNQGNNNNNNNNHDNNNSNNNSDKKNNKEGEDGKNDKNSKDDKDNKDGKDGKDSKEVKDGKNEKNRKDGKDNKDNKDNKSWKDGKEGKDNKDNKDSKDGKNGKDDNDSKGGSNSNGNKSNNVWQEIWNDETESSEQDNMEWFWEEVLKTLEQKEEELEKPIKGEKLSKIIEEAKEKADIKELIDIILKNIADKWKDERINWYKRHVYIKTSIWISTVNNINNVWLILPECKIKKKKIVNYLLFDASGSMDLKMVEEIIFNIHKFLLKRKVDSIIYYASFSTDLSEVKKIKEENWKLYLDIIHRWWTYLYWNLIKFLENIKKTKEYNSKEYIKIFTLVTDFYLYSDDFDNSINKILKLPTEFQIVNIISTGINLKKALENLNFQKIWRSSIYTINNKILYVHNPTNE